jgi:DNA-binding PadR family transcriptional regulator
VPPVETDRVERLLLLHLLAHHGQQVRFEASQWVTEFGIVRQFAQEPPETIRRALHTLEMSRLIYRRTQYVVGYSEPKHVFSLTQSGHRKAIEFRDAADSGDRGLVSVNGAPPESSPPNGSLDGDEGARPPHSSEPTV